MQTIDAQHFNELYELNFGKIYNFIYFRTHHKETAEDLTSKTFIKAWGNIDKFDAEKGSFSTWIYAIARNNIIDHFRKTKNQGEIVNIDLMLDISSPENIANNTELKDQLEKVKEYLKTLPDEQRDIVIMRIWDELSYKEIAGILSKSEASCKMSFYRTMEKLQTQFSIAIIILLTLWTSNYKTY